MEEKDYFICDVCGREVNGITIVNGMNFCAKCYQETFVIPKPLSVQDLENCVKIECTQCKEKDKRIAELEEELAELKENSIVPKFNFGDTIFAVVTYIDDPKDKTVIESGIVQKIECDKNQIKYWCDNGRIYWEDECEKLFATEQEAQQKLKELEKK